MSETFGTKEEAKAFENIDKINSAFTEVCLENNLTNIPRVPLVATGDETLLFTNSSMSPFKEIIENSEIPQSGLFIIQECLRSNDLNQLFITEADLKWQSYFYMLGCIVDKHDFQKLVDVTKGLLRSLNIQTDTVIVKNSTNFRYFNTSDIAFDGFKVISDSEEPDYYNWKYGMQTVIGEGVTLAIKYGETEYDIGNIICFIKDNEIIGWELAFGSEVLLAAHGNKSPFETSTICDVLLYEDRSDFRKFADSLMSTIEIINVGVLPSSKKEGFVLRKYIKALINLSHQFSQYYLEDLIEEYCLIKGYDSTKILDVLGKEFKRFNESKVSNIKAFTNFYKKNFQRELGTDWFRVAYESFSLDENDAKIIIDNTKNSYD